MRTPDDLDAEETAHVLGKALAGTRTRRELIEALGRTAAGSAVRSATQ